MNRPADLFASGPSAALPSCLARWSTAAFADAADTLPMDLQSLSAHVRHCSGGRSRGDRIHGATLWAGSVVRMRLVSSALAALLLLGLLLWLVA